MVNNRMTEGVGKKIVDALKKQSDIDIVQPFQSEQTNEQDDQPVFANESMPSLEFLKDTPQKTSEPSMSFENFSNESAKPSFNMNFNSIPEQTVQNHQTLNNDSFMGDFEDLELPANVEVLRQLITKIPSNVSKQTGAQIIKQTMEALGISMKGVLQEAQQAQENLNSAARECQNNIAEYRRQINVLETQTQKLHRQYSMLNDIISLFIQAGN